VVISGKWILQPRVFPMDISEIAPQQNQQIEIDMRLK